MAELRRTGSSRFTPTLALLNANENKNATREHPTVPVYLRGVQKRSHQLGYSLDEFWLHEPGMTGRRLASILRTRGIRGAVIVGLLHDHRLPQQMRPLWDEIPATVTGVPEALAGRQHLVNLSVRGVTAPEAPMITGFAIGGTTAKQVLIRVAGPALTRAPFNLQGTLPDPSLQLFRVSTVIGQNNDWGSPASGAAALSAATTRAGAFPFANGSADAALLTTLPPGVYSVQVGGDTGVALAEVYEVTASDETPGSRRLVNVSTLGAVAPGLPLIAGFVIEGPGPQRVLIRAAGPTLGAAPFNVAGALANPQLAIFQGSAQIKANDDWFRETEAAAIRDAAARSNAFAFGAQSLDSAVLLFLEPGAYTAVISASATLPAAQATGLALVEIYDASP